MLIHTQILLQHYPIPLATNYTVTAKCIVEASFCLSQIECELVKQAVSLYCRLGFAKNLQPPPVVPQHVSWKDAVTTHNHQPYVSYGNFCAFKLSYIL